VHRLREPRHRPAATARATAPLEHRPHLGADRAPRPVHPGPRGDRAVRAVRRGVQQGLHAGGRGRNLAYPRPHGVAAEARAGRAARLVACSARRRGRTARWVVVLTGALPARAGVVLEGAEDLRALAVTTVGLSNLVSAGHSPIATWTPSTINTLVVVDADPEP